MAEIKHSLLTGLELHNSKVNLGVPLETPIYIGETRFHDGILYIATGIISNEDWTPAGGSNTLVETIDPNINSKQTGQLWFNKANNKLFISQSANSLDWIWVNKPIIYQLVDPSNQAPLYKGATVFNVVNGKHWIGYNRQDHISTDPDQLAWALLATADFAQEPPPSS